MCRSLTRMVSFASHTDPGCAPSRVPCDRGGTRARGNTATARLSLRGRATRTVLRVCPSEAGQPGPTYRNSDIILYPGFAFLEFCPRVATSSLETNSITQINGYNLTSHPERTPKSYLSHFSPCGGPCCNVLGKKMTLIGTSG